MIQSRSSLLQKAIFAALPPLLLFAVAAQTTKAESVRHELFTIEVDGSNLTKLHQREGWSASSPQWSEDGRQIAYDSWCDYESFRTSQVVIAHADGSDPQYLCTGAMPNWSTNDTKIAYHHYRDSTGVTIINADGNRRPPDRLGMWQPALGPQRQCHCLC